MSWILSFLSGAGGANGAVDRLHDCYFAAVAGDAPAFEAWPSKAGMYYQPSPNSLPPILTLA